MGFRLASLGKKHCWFYFAFSHVAYDCLKAILIYLFVSRHEVHSMNTHTLQNAG